MAWERLEGAGPWCWAEPGPAAWGQRALGCCVCVPGAYAGGCDAWVREGAWEGQGEPGALRLPPSSVQKGSLCSGSLSLCKRAVNDSNRPHVTNVIATTSPRMCRFLSSLRSPCLWNVYLRPRKILSWTFAPPQVTAGASARRACASPQNTEFILVW